MLVRGDKLSTETRETVLRRYSNRWTVENERCIRHQRDAVKAKGVEPAPLVSDDKWLAEHAFYVKRNGSLDERRNHCEPHYMAEV